MANENNPNVKSIVASYLVSRGFGGLYDKDETCGCEITDLIPCDRPYAIDCLAGYKIPCDCGEGCEWHITSSKPTPNPKDN